ncbi:MAG: rhombosortase [Phycisphaerae bacterium]|nr:rhombosortase [Phycisphaerae bacterium]
MITPPAGRPTATARCWVSLLLAGFCLVAALLHVEPLLEFDRAAIASGAWWRMLSGHAVHFGFEHLAWDLGVFVLLAALIERRDRAALVWCVVAAAVTISLNLWFFAPTIVIYRGLSGIDSALVAMYATQVLMRRGEHSRSMRLIVGLALAGLAAKTVIEFRFGATVFVNHVAASFEPVPIAHLVGGATGALLAMCAATTSSLREVAPGQRRRWRRCDRCQPGNQ